MVYFLIIIWSIFQLVYTDVLAKGSQEGVRASVTDLINGLKDTRVLFSREGRMPPNVSTENIRAFNLLNS